MTEANLPTSAPVPPVVRLDYAGPTAIRPKRLLPTWVVAMTGAVGAILAFSLEPFIGTSFGFLFACYYVVSRSADEDGVSIDIKVQLAISSLIALLSLPFLLNSYVGRSHHLELYVPPSDCLPSLGILLGAIFWWFLARRAAARQRQSSTRPTD